MSLIYNSFAHKNKANSMPFSIKTWAIDSKKRQLSLLDRLNVDAHMRVLAVFLLQLVFYVGSMVVSMGDAQLTGDTHVKLDGDAAADAACL